MKYICNANDICKREDCYHAKPHEYDQTQGCGNSRVCYRLEDATKGSEGPIPAPVCEEVKE